MALDDERIRVHLRISGRVQGVWFRQSMKEEADRLGGLSGWVRNLPDGDVEAVIEGPPARVEPLVQWCHRGPPAAKVTHVQRTDEPPEGETGGFEVRR